jgi:DUF4097 and DUF4098 domain-containing protein YvlB
MKNLLTAMLIIAFGTAIAQDKKINKTFSNVKRIDIQTSSGDINFKKGSGSDVKVELTYSYSDDEYTPEFDQSGDELVISEKFTRGSHSGSAKWTLEVPESITLSINSGSGDVTINAVSTKVKLNVGSGDIEVTSLKAGRVDLNTGSGDIELRNNEGEFSANTGSGEIMVESAKGEYSLNAGSGDIRLDQVAAILSVNTGSGNIRADNIVLTGRGKFNTGSGDARVSLAKVLDHNITVNSGSGDSKLSFNGNEISGEVVMTANKRGGEIIAPFKFDTEETIDDGNSERIQKTAKLGTKSIRIKVGTGSGTAEITK